jgi:hypothetical protein
MENREKLFFYLNTKQYNIKNFDQKKKETSKKQG